MDVLSMWRRGRDRRQWWRGGGDAPLSTSLSDLSAHPSSGGNGGIVFYTAPGGGGGGGKQQQQQQQQQRSGGGVPLTRSSSAPDLNNGDDDEALHYNPNQYTATAAVAAAMVAPVAVAVGVSGSSNGVPKKTAAPPTIPRNKTAPFTLVTSNSAAALPVPVNAGGAAAGAAAATKKSMFGGGGDNKPARLTSDDDSGDDDAGDNGHRPTRKLLSPPPPVRAASKGLPKWNVVAVKKQQKVVISPPMNAVKTASAATARPSPAPVTPMPQPPVSKAPPTSPPADLSLSKPNTPSGRFERRLDSDSSMLSISSVSSVSSVVIAPENDAEADEDTTLTVGFPTPFSSAASTAQHKMRRRSLSAPIVIDLASSSASSSATSSAATLSSTDSAAAVVTQSGKTVKSALRTVVHGQRRLLVPLRHVRFAFPEISDVIYRHVGPQDDGTWSDSSNTDDDDSFDDDRSNDDEDDDDDDDDIPVPAALMPLPLRVSSLKPGQASISPAQRGPPPAAPVRVPATTAAAATAAAASSAMSHSSQPRDSVAPSTSPSKSIGRGPPPRPNQPSKLLQAMANMQEFDANAVLQSNDPSSRSKSYAAAVSSAPVPPPSRSSSVPSWSAAAARQSSKTAPPVVVNGSQVSRGAPPPPPTSRNSNQFVRRRVNSDSDSDGESHKPVIPASQRVHDDDDELLAAMGPSLALSPRSASHATKQTPLPPAPRVTPTAIYAAAVENARIPPLISECCEEIDRRGLLTEGIFRLPGSMAYLNNLMGMYQRGQRHLLDNVPDCITIAGLLKLYLRSMQPPLLPNRAYEDLQRALRYPDDASKVAVVRSVLFSLPAESLATLRAVINLLATVALHGDTNLMSADNLAKSVGPSLLVDMTVDSAALVTLLFIRKQDVIFELK